jgi:hypothetical protein
MTAQLPLTSPNLNRWTRFRYPPLRGTFSRGEKEAMRRKALEARSAATLKLHLLHLQRDPP